MFESLVGCLVPTRRERERELTSLFASTLVVTSYTVLETSSWKRKMRDDNGNYNNNQLEAGAKRNENLSATT